MKRLELSLIAIMFLLLGVMGCSDLSKNKIVDNPIQSSQFDAGCELDIDEFKNILKKDISFQIDCLGRNLDLFMRVVESGRPGHLSRTAFERYVIKYVPDFDPQNVRAIKALFDVSHLFFGEDPEYISPQAVRKIIDFAYLFNREAIRVYPLFSSTEDNTAFNLHRIFRERVYTGTLNISSALLDIFNKTDRGGNVHKLNIVELLDAFSTEGTDSVLEKLKAALFVKRLLLGGEREIITHVELKDLLNKLVPLSPIAYDIARLKYLDLNQKSQMEMILSDIERMEPLLYFTPDSSERLFSMKELADAVSTFAENSGLPDFRKYPDQLVELKMTLMSTTPWSEDQDLSGKEWVLPSEFKMLIDHAKDLANRGAVYHRIYEFFKTQLESPASININYNNYLLQFPTHEKYVKEFARIATSYRFFNGSFEAPYYSPAIRRNAEAIVEVGVMEDILTTVFRRYGDSTKGLGGYGATQDQLLNVFKVYKKLLVEEDLITDGLEPRTNQNLTLLSTLFQYQSNGDGIIDVNEMTELASTVLTSFSAADFFQEELNRLCPTDDRGRVTDLDCYRKEFFGLACRKYQKFFPRFFESIGMTTCASGNDKDWSEKNFADVEKYLKTLEVVARTCTVFNDGSDVPMDNGDYMTLWVMLMNIEGTVVRYDANGNNKMDPSEVRKAYSVAFHPAVEALVKEQAAVIAKLPFNLGKSISKKIYYYLIKYGAIPKSIKQYAKLIFIGASTANRQTIAAVLKVIGEQGEPNTFDCETLR